VNRVDLHPEQLFDRLRAGSISRDDYELLQSHCEACTACQLELHLVFEPMGAPVPDPEDRALGISIVDRMLHTPQSDAPAARRIGGGHLQRGRSAAFIAAGVVLGCSMTAAALVPNLPLAVARAVGDFVGLSRVVAADGKPRRANVALHAAKRGAAPPDLAAFSAAVASSAATTVSGALVQLDRADLAQQTTPALAAADDARDSAFARERPGAAATAVKRSSAKSAGRDGRGAGEGADWLLSAAARARARGDYAEAADYYRMLQRHYPNTEAEIVARVSLGRLLCLRLGQPKGALDLFDAYLSERPRGALGQEARNGRALCLDRLGRKQEARAAWGELVARYPTSVYADEARVRLAEP
jgi:TolA-binding protein